MKKGQAYRCQNPQCGCEIEVTKSSMEAMSNPRCCCGGEMKKPYEKPVLKSLEHKSIAFVDLFETKE